MNRIREILFSTEKESVKELAEKMNVTPETIRSDLDGLEEQGLIVREHGYARAAKNIIEIPFEMRKAENYALKRTIAFRAISEIQDGMMVFLDSGSTIFAGLEILKSKKDLTIVTNALHVAEACLEMNFKVILIGGLMNPAGKRADGYFAEKMLDGLHMDLAILSSDGIENLGGIGVFYPEEFGTKTKVVERSDRSIAVIDRTKFSRTSAYKAVDFKDIDLVITNTLNDEQRKQLEGLVEVLETRDSV